MSFPAQLNVIAEPPPVHPRLRPVTSKTSTCINLSLQLEACAKACFVKLKKRLLWLLAQEKTLSCCLLLYRRPASNLLVSCGLCTHWPAPCNLGCGVRVTNSPSWHTAWNKGGQALFSYMVLMSFHMLLWLHWCAFWFDFSAPILWLVCFLVVSRSSLFSWLVLPGFDLVLLMFPTAQL